MAIAAAAVFANSLNNGFALDDLPLVRDNPAIRSLESLPLHWTEPYWGAGDASAGLYRPLTLSSFTLNRAIFGPAATGYHAVNVALHVAVSLLVWCTARAISGRPGGATLAALLFALHPLHSEAVANIAGRAELLGALWVLSAWACHRRSSDAAGRAAHGWSAAALGCFALALASKENTVLAPLLFLLGDLQARRAADRAGRYVGYGAVLAAMLALRFAVLGGLKGAGDAMFIDNPAAFSGAAVRVATAGWVQLRYLTLLVWPHPLSSDYSFDAIPRVLSTVDPRLWAGLLALATPLAATALGWRRSRALALGASIWLLFMLPGSNLLFPAGTLMAERLAYLPSAGACLIAGHLAARLLAHSGRPRVAAIAGFVFLAVSLAWTTVARNPDWRNNATLALADVRSYPRSAKLQAGAGIALHARGDLEAAARAYRRALEIYPDYAQIHYNLGELLSLGDDLRDPIEHLERATQLAPDNPRPYKRLAELLELVGRPDDALHAYETGARLDPADLPLRFNQGRLLLAQGRREEALVVLHRLSSDAPRSLPGRLATALAARADGDESEAQAIYRELLGERLPPEIRARVERLAGD